jgi:antitoxin component YwqK of YwqJK toxin-antitoxin module
MPTKTRTITKPKPTRPTKTEREEDRIDHHKDGTIRAKGKMLGGLLHGYWEWFRIDGTKMRSGYLDRGKQVGQWKTYTRDGRVVKVTEF